MGLKDYTGIVKKHQVSFLEAKEVHEGYFQILLAKDDVKWKAGEHGIFSIDNHKIEGKGWRAFSFASIEEEDVILLGTRSIGEMSEFKKTLFSLEKGEKVNIRGPFGAFTLKDETTPIVFIALGIGITPVRSLIKEIDDKDYQQDVHVVYSSEGYFMFKEELEEIIGRKSNQSIEYPSSVEETKEAIKAARKRYQNSAYYYISGPPKVIKEVKNSLLAEGIEKKRMMNDPFMGY